MMTTRYIILLEKYNSDKEGYDYKEIIVHSTNILVTIWWLERSGYTVIHYTESTITRED